MSTILVADDDRLLLDMLCDTLKAEGHTVVRAASGEEALDWFALVPIDLVLLDMVLPDLNGIQVLRRMKARNADIPVLIMTAYHQIQSAVEAMKAQAADYLCKPLDRDELKLLVRRLLDAADQLQRLKRLQEAEVERQRPTQLIGESQVIQNIRQLIDRVATSQGRVVLIAGESGTGKELVARGLHAQSPRRRHPFVEINCATLSPTLFESELFGHERGAFTDAKATTRGLAEAADQGTLFLDEIGEMALPFQAKFLRFLGDRRFRRVGGTQDITVDTRVVAASNRNLPQMVEAGAFRKDLYYRLNVLAIEVPPLRQRPADVPPLARHFLEDATRKFRKAILGFTPEAEQLLAAYPWPGNVRELRNVVERIVLLESAERIGREHLPPEIAGDPQAAASARDISRLYPTPLEDVEQAYIAAVLAQVGGNKTRAAEILGITRRTLRARIPPSSPA